MLDIDDIIQDILRREGGYVDDPQDPGGATNFGVTIGTMRKLGIDLDGDGDVDKTDVRLLDVGRASEIFKEHYYQRPNIWQLPEKLQPSVFDMLVNSGANAVKILQRLLQEFGNPTAVDGMIGPDTARAALAAFNAAPEHLVNAYGIARRNYYYDLGDRRPNLRKFARRRDGGKGGWIKRSEEFMDARFHLTRAQHDDRVRLWT